MGLSKYEIIEEIGRGGFGVVYKAYDPSLDVYRAIKVLHPGLILDTNTFARFNQEAKLTAKLDHPNIVPVFDMGEDNGHWYIVMKYMEGGSLVDRFGNNNSFTYQKVIGVFQDICAGLSFAHENGIIHRDLKPGNILFDEKGHARISDLGFAKALNSSGSLSMSTSGAMIGTPPYMAPEIWKGKRAAPATDIYSLGCILYEMLSGQVLFKGESPADVMTMHVMEKPEIPLHWSENIRTVLIKALQKEPELRYQTAQAFWEDLAIEESQRQKSPRTILPNGSSQPKIKPSKEKPKKGDSALQQINNRYPGHRKIRFIKSILILGFICYSFVILGWLILFDYYMIYLNILGITASIIGYFALRKIKIINASPQKMSSKFGWLNLGLIILSSLAIFLGFFVFFSYPLLFLSLILGIVTLSITFFDLKKSLKVD